MTSKIEELVVQASSDPLNPVHNFNIAVEYDELGQTAAAVGFYLRAVEYGHQSNDLIAYTSLLRIALCMDKQKDRNHTSKNSLLQAVSLLPFRPEAYFLLSRHYERTQDWMNCYMTASIGKCLPTPEQGLFADVEYPGKYGFDFELAVSGWWIGRANQSKDLFNKLLEDPEVDESHKQACRYNLERI